MEFILEKIPNLEKEQIIRIPKSLRNKIQKSYPDFNDWNYKIIDRQTYHIKSVDLNTIFNELIGKIISEYFKDKQNKSKIIRKDYLNFYLITENFLNYDSSYVYMNSGVFPNIQFDKNGQMELSALEKINIMRIKGKEYCINENDLNNLKYRLKVMIMNDYIREHCDRWYYNFMFEINKGYCKLAPLYDFELSFQLFDGDLENSFNFDLTNIETRKFIKNDDQFQELLILAMDLNMKKVFEQLFDEYPVILTKEEQQFYEDTIKRKKDEIKRYKLIK